MASNANGYNTISLRLQPATLIALTGNIYAKIELANNLEAP